MTAPKNNQPQTPQNTTTPKKRYQHGRIGRRVSLVVTCLLVALVLGWMASQPQNLPETGSEAPVSATSLPPGAAQGPTINPADWNTPTPLEQDKPATMLQPDYRMMALPENGRVDRSYFNTVTFVGDSLTQGLQMYSTGLANASYCAYKNISPKSIYDGSLWPNREKVSEAPLEALVASQPDNVYILIGANAMGGTQDDVLIEYYRIMLQKIKEVLHPDVAIYVQSLTPVSPTARFTLERIEALNNQLANLAREEGVYFINLHEALAGDDGYLWPEFATGDGMHLKPAGYAAWVDYLETHTAYHPRNPYLENAAPYTPPSFPTEEAPLPAEETPPA